MRLYLLDEHISRKYQTQLLRHAPSLTVLVMGDADAPERGTSDADILRWCEKNNFTLVTNNRESMPKHLQEHLDAGRHVPGIFTIDLGKMGLVLEDLILIAEAAGDDEYMDRITHIPLR